MMLHRCVLASLVFLLAGCGQPRPEALQGDVCKSIPQAGRTPYPWPDIYEGIADASPPAPLAAPASALARPRVVTTPATQAFRSKLAGQAASRRAARPPPIVPSARSPALVAPPTRVLSVSAGGAWGAFSVGFLEGWGQNSAEPRPRFDVVTGVSTGSMIAPVVFLNDPARLARLRGLYASLRNEDVFTPRGTLSLLSATSLYNNAPLRRTVSAMLDDDMINAIAAENGPRTLAVLATNLDSGVPDVFDLTDIAADPGMSMAQKRQRMVAAIMASAALPIGFPPEIIDGNMYVDGGVRMHVFLSRQIEAALPGEPVDISIVVSGDMKVARECTGAGKDGLDLLSVAARTASIATDQLLRTSVESLLSVGRQRGNVARYIDAAPLIDYGASVPQPGMPEPGPCKLSTNSADIFDPVFQACLAEQGALTGQSNPIPWRLTVAGTRITRNAGRSLDR
ncbi:MAG: patatin-like phospholipase family protein [Enhydrobacter sp.]|nr:patatin-like phospholipase family protein [Enhydrobacter sp.]